MIYKNILTEHKLLIILSIHLYVRMRGLKVIQILRPFYLEVQINGIERKSQTWFKH